MSAAFDCDDADAENTRQTDLDGDCDGVLTVDDCDDARPELGECSCYAGDFTDYDCDGAAEADDCDDENVTLGGRFDDWDCDGVLNLDDTDADGDGILNAEDADSDGDGVPQDEDCDDGDIRMLRIGDCDGDGLAPGDEFGGDCDDMNPRILDCYCITEADDGLFADDDCDDVDYRHDCNDYDPFVSDGWNDRDCDGITDGADPNMDGDGLYNWEDDDVDGDGAPNDEDCDVLNDRLGHCDCSINGIADFDCDGIPSTVDCGDRNRFLYHRYNDWDCDGIDNYFTTDPGGNWYCSEYECYYMGDDIDGDGYSQWQDCDEYNPFKNLPRDCDHDADGVEDWLDCNDYDERFANNREDCDEDGVLKELDCDDADPLVGDCDGVLPGCIVDGFRDADCDGFHKLRDCDDGDAQIGVAENDFDCDGIPDAEDHDADNDGFFMGQDCYDLDAQFARWDDCDGDGVYYSNDCDDFDIAAGHQDICDGTGAEAGIRGDGLIGGTEECDDGNLVSGDGCNKWGGVERGWSCNGEPSVCQEQ